VRARRGDVKRDRPGGAAGTPPRRCESRAKPAASNGLRHGHTLQLSGRARILWEREDYAELKGAERAVEVEIGEVVEIAGQGPLGWRFLEYSPFNPR
jgi:hypothetical protein